jgi:hypothetical protein
MALTEEMQYAPGDTFALACPNEAKEVAEVIERLGLPEATLDSPLQLAVANGTKKRGAAIPAHLTGHGLTTRVCLAAALDLRAPLTKGGIRMLSEYVLIVVRRSDRIHPTSVGLCPVCCACQVRVRLDRTGRDDVSELTARSGRVPSGVQGNSSLNYRTPSSLPIMQNSACAIA